MFESLTADKRERRIAQPMLSFAIHASLIALAVGRSPERFDLVQEPIRFDDVIYVPDREGSRTKVESGRETPVPGPVRCDCEIDLPGPIEPVTLPGKPETIPGHPVVKPIGSPGRSILDPGPFQDRGIYPEGDLTDSPVLVHLPQPAYPSALKAAGVEGTVQVIYVVDINGGVEPESITIVSSDHPFMTESVRAALVEARFRPGKVRGTAVRSLVRQTIRFSLMSL